MTTRGTTQGFVLPIAVNIITPAIYESLSMAGIVDIKGARILLGIVWIVGFVSVWISEGIRKKSLIHRRLVTGAWASGSAVLCLLVCYYETVRSTSILSIPVAAVTAKVPPMPSVADPHDPACQSHFGNVLSNIEIDHPEGTPVQLNNSNCNQFNGVDVTGAPPNAKIQLNNSNLNQFNRLQLHFAPVYVPPKP